jgi:hypothetical protein
MKDTNTSNTFWGSIIAGFLGALGGAENSNKNFRRIGLPLFLAGIAWQQFHNWYIFSIFLMIPILCIGYGLNSLLYRVFYALFGHNGLLADIFTRSTLGCLLSCTLAPIALITQNYLLFIVGMLTIILVFGSLSWRDLGSFKFQGKQLIWSEFIPYASIGIVSLILIYF